MTQTWINPINKKILQLSSLDIETSLEREEEKNTFWALTCTEKIIWHSEHTQNFFSNTLILREQETSGGI